MFLEKFKKCFGKCLFGKHDWKSFLFPLHETSPCVAPVSLTDCSAISDYHPKCRLHHVVDWLQLMGWKTKCLGLSWIWPLVKWRMKKPPQEAYGRTGDPPDHNYTGVSGMLCDNFWHSLVTTAVRDHGFRSCLGTLFIRNLLGGSILSPKQVDCVNKQVKVQVVYKGVLDI